jgi:hypothetical protein
MASLSVAATSGESTADLLCACVADQGTATHPYILGDALVAGPEAPRNLADMIHLLCALHGRHPGVVDHAAGRSTDPVARRWLIEAAEAMATERTYLVRLAVAAGPVPGTPGAAGNEAMLIAQRSALSVLAQSDRQGCALGAALAFALDWAAVRDRLDDAARRLGVPTPPFALGGEGDVRLVVDSAGGDPATARALLFGARQLALQQRSLWDLLEARAEARAAL